MQLGLQDQIPPVFKLPPELHHQVISSLEAKHIIALRKTCHYFFVLTQEHGIWTALFNRMRATQPLPCSRSEFSAMVAPQTERVLLAASKIEESFLLRRECTMQNLVSGQPMTTLCALSFVSEFFLLSVVRAFTTAIIQVWDVSTPRPSLLQTPYASLTLDRSCIFLTHAVSASADKSLLYVAVNKYTAPHHRIQIYSVPLCSNGLVTNDHRPFASEADFLVQPEDTIEYIDPCSCRALIHHAPTSVDVLNWRDGTRSQIAILPENLDEMWEWNDVTSLRLCGPYVLCFRFHSIEAYPLPMGTPETVKPVSLPLLQHRFRSMTFNTVSLSRIRHSPRPSGDVFTVFMLANDLYEGMFHYQITVMTTPVPSLSVKLLAHTSTAVSAPTLVQGNDVASEHALGNPYLSAWALGSVGLRGVWVTALRNDFNVIAFITHPSRLRSGEQPSSQETLNDSEERMPYMNGEVVSTVRLHHPRGMCRLGVDWAHCAWFTDWSYLAALTRECARCSKCTIDEMRYLYLLDRPDAT